MKKILVFSATYNEKDNIKELITSIIQNNKNIDIQDQNKLLYKTLKGWDWLALNISEGT